MAALLDRQPPPGEAARGAQGAEGGGDAEEPRAAWERSWAYVCQLAQWSFHEGLLDRRSLVEWLLEKLARAGAAAGDGRCAPPR